MTKTGQALPGKVDTRYTQVSVQHKRMDIHEVRALVERALEDGRLSLEEMNDIEAAIMADDLVTDEEKQLLEEIRLKVLRGDVKVG